MKKLAILAAAALLAALALPLFSGSALATIHPIVSSECAAQESGTGAGENQDPPGQTPGATPGEGALKAISALLDNGALTVDMHGSEDPGDWTWGGPAYNGDSGDSHCQNPEAPNTHPD